ncbi:hypothetical protein DFR24_3479 [Panacagrimonas perspica]|uniref:Uncharacterized protein n=1 Tax=Panacagrimonas perspica TaxID=381431 RepID=A0A4R7NYP0_9GAMM|nr:hypothetical protein DFR24_3479 [Panacagrimonas perspica]
MEKQLAGDLGWSTKLLRAPRLASELYVPNLYPVRHMKKE